MPPFCDRLSDSHWRELENPVAPSLSFILGQKAFKVLETQELGCGRDLDYPVPSPVAFSNLLPSIHAN